MLISNIFLTIRIPAFATMICHAVLSNWRAGGRGKSPNIELPQVIHNIVDHLFDIFFTTDIASGDESSSA
jgi:hypothetical protein